MRKAHTGLWYIWIFAMVLLAGLLGGCQENAPAASGSVAQAAVVSPDVQESAAASAAAPDNWPASVPADVPPLPGTIQNVKTGGERIRIFYTALARQDVLAYVEKMKANGFQAQFEAYVKEQPGITPSPKSADEWEGVSLTKGSYALRITVNTIGGGTYDLEGLPADAYTKSAS